MAYPLTSFFRRWTARTVLEFRARIDRHKLVRRKAVKEELLRDPQVLAAVGEHARERGLAESAVTRRVEEYLDEIVPSFNILSYYKIGYNLSRLLINFFYKVTVEHQDAPALNRIPKRDVVVYLMNHRSNADYVVVTYVLARVVSISYAVGEWARTWPLEYVFKSFGSYFIRRRYREALYHTVLERYVQLITRNRVTQGIFPEGGLTRDGTLRPAKLGLLDYIVRTLRDPAFGADVWLVPVAINYDRVLEDRTLTAELIVGGERPSRLRQLLWVTGFVGLSLFRLLGGRRRRYGRVAVNFGAPVSVRSWLAKQPDGILELPRSARLPHLQRLAELAMTRLGGIIPVTPVPFAAAALLSFNTSLVSRESLLERMAELAARLAQFNAKMVRGGVPVAELWERAWRTFGMRRFVVGQGDQYVLLPNARPLLEYYANSIRHLLPEEQRWELSPAVGEDPGLPRLGSPPSVSS